VTYLKFWDIDINTNICVRSLYSLTTTKFKTLIELLALYAKIFFFRKTARKNKQKIILFSVPPVPVHRFRNLRDADGQANIHEAQTKCLEKKRGRNFSQSINMSQNFNYSKWRYLQCNPENLSNKDVSGQHVECNVSLPFLPTAFRTF
jgi:hypothetical protein